MTLTDFAGIKGNIICFINIIVMIPTGLIIFYIIHPVSHGKALSLYIITAAVCLSFPHYSRIHQKVSAVRESERTAGKAAVPVKSVGGK